MMKFIPILLAATLISACTPADPNTTAAAKKSADASVVADDAAADYEAVMTAADAAAAAADAASLAATGGAPIQQIDHTPQEFSKGSFDNYVYGMTKRELRQRFGSPSGVHSDGKWYYFDLPVYDEEAGIKAHTVTIEFMGMGGMEDEVASVRY